MNIQALKELLEKIPVTALLGAYVVYLGYDYYSFTSDSSSPLLMKQQEIATAQSDITNLKNKIKQVNDFAQTLNLKKAQLRTLAQDLEATKATLSEELDIAELMKTLLIEAKRSGLTVTALKPVASKNGDFYVEQDFEFASTGIYFQYIAFLERISNLQKIIRVDSFSFSPNSSPSAKYVQLKSVVLLKAYRYLGSKADEIAKSRSSTSDTPKPASRTGT